MTQTTTTRIDATVGAVRTRTRRSLPIPDWRDVSAALCYLALAGLVMSRQWADLSDGYLAKSGQDQTMWEWFFGVAAHSLVHLDNPLGTTLQNHPLGVNMMANTAMFGVSIPLAPVTLLFGPTVTYVLVLTAGLCGTAFAWYRLFARELVESRFAAAVGGLFCGFAPAMVSHANGHPNFVALFLLPVIAGQVLRVSRGTTRPGRDGLLLGLLVATQIALGEEPLLLFAIAFGLFAVCYYVQRPRALVGAVRGAAVPLGLGAAVALLLTVIPLWWQFVGPQSYTHIDHGQMGNDLKALVQFPSESLGGWALPGQNVFINPTEENAYFGWPLLALLAVVGIWLWRNAVARAAGIVAVVMVTISLGAELVVGREPTGITLPWHRLQHYPLLESVLETRFAIAAIPLFALLLALATDRALRSNFPILWFTALAVALVPLTPTPLPVVERPDAPGFFADGTWRGYVSGGAVVVVPLPRPEDAGALRWQEEQNFEFPLAGGYFVGPAGAEKKGKYGPDDRPTAWALHQVAATGRVPEIDAGSRATAVADLRFWHADVVVLPAGPNVHALRAALNQYLGFPGTRVADVWVWDVRPLTR